MLGPCAQPGSVTPTFWAINAKTPAGSPSQRSPGSPIPRRIVFSRPLSGL